jgi:hypothetical protein
MEGSGMMTKFATRTATLLLTAAFACGTGATTFAASRAYCDAEARRFADAYTNTGGNIVGSAAAGAIGGAILGGIFGGSSKKVGKGALIGTGVGTAAGVVGSAASWQQHYDEAFYACVAEARPVNRAAGGPPPGTDAWYAYCSKRYRSFNPDTGMFLSNAGYWKPCR